MGVVLDALVAALVAGRAHRRQRGPKPHPVPPGLWRDFVNGLCIGFALVSTLLAVALGWVVWRFLTDDLLSILGVILLPFAATAVAGTLSFAAHAIAFTRRQ